MLPGEGRAGWAPMATAWTHGAAMQRGEALGLRPARQNLPTNSANRAEADTQEGGQGSRLLEDGVLLPGGVLQGGGWGGGGHRPNGKA